MGKNIVVFSDGTGQEGGTDHNTNVYKLFNMIMDRSSSQVSFYDRGLGTGWRKATGNIGGRGFSKNVLQCYEFIFENYQVGDRIFLFGFSRGAATVRSLAGFIHYFGILPKSRGKLIDKAWKIYKKPKTREAKAESFVKMNHTMWAHVDFLGVWDTVAALGVPNSALDHALNFVVPHEFHDFKLSPSVLNAYHAMAIDDLRKTFHPVFFSPDLPEGGMTPTRDGKKRTLKQVWFMGMHTDVGGGYGANQASRALGGNAHKALSDIVLEWMMQNAVRHGLRIYRPGGSPIGECTPNPNGFMHDSRGRAWKKRIFPAKRRWWDKEEFGRAMVHQSVKERELSVHNEKPKEGERTLYKPWILDEEHAHQLEPWTHLEDWKNDREWLENADEGTVKALEGWCVPTRPSMS